MNEVPEHLMEEDPVPLKEDESKLLPPMQIFGSFPDLCSCPMLPESGCHVLPNALKIVDLHSLHGNHSHLFWWPLLCLPLYSPVDCMYTTQAARSHAAVNEL